MKNKLSLILLASVSGILMLFFTLHVVKAAPRGTPNNIIYGANREEADILIIDLFANSVVLTGTSAPPLLYPTQAMAQSPVNQRVYYFERNFGTSSFAYWDPVSGNNVEVQAAAASDFPKRLAFAPNGQLYMMDFYDQLFEVDVATGDTTLLGAVTGLVTGDLGGTGDFAFAPDGTLYLNTYGTLYTLDIPSMTVTELYTGMLPAGDTSVWTGLAYCDDLLIGSAVYLTPFVSSLYQTIPATGLSTEIYSSTDPTFLFNDLTSCHPENVDYSDLPASFGYALHESPHNIQLGATINDDLISAVAADNASDDGVSQVGEWAPGAAVSIDVTVVGGSGQLAAYFDWNNDGDFNDGQEQPINQAVTVGVNNIAVSVPATSTGVLTDLYARFRLYPTGAPTIAATGQTSDGEVEDYIWGASPTALTFSSFTQAPASTPYIVVAAVGLIMVALTYRFARRRKF